jgi:hypothetical protein
MKKNRRKQRPTRENEPEQKPFFPPKQVASAENGTAFFQPQLEIDPINSPAEREADAVAEQVVNRPQQSQSSAGVQREKMQAKRISRMEEEEPAAKRISRMEEEEPAAKRISRMEEEEPAAKRISRMEEEEPAAKRISRMEEEEPAAKRMGSAVAEPLSRKADPQAPLAPPADFEARIARTKGQGMPLPDDLRSELEAEFGADFSQVRIHTDPEAVALTRAIQAHAFTHGHDLYFNQGRFAPGSPAGKTLLAHELTHVVQQKGTGQ